MIAVCTAMSIGAAVVLDVPEPQLSDGLLAVVPDTEAAINAAIGPAVGPDGRYLVRWNDALLIGSQGYGLVNELERDGYHVGVQEAYHVPVTPQRVFQEGSEVKAGESAEYVPHKTRHLYLVPAAGSIEINGVRVNARDGAAIRDEDRLTITALEDSEIVLVDAA